MKVTIKDVAREAGVSISTVSKVMNNSSRISDETKRRVRKIMGDLNYYPNVLARNLVQQSSMSIGIVMEIQRSYAFRNPYIFEILGGIEEVAHKNHYSVNLINLHSTTQHNEVRKLIAEKRIDGIIFQGLVMNKPMVDTLTEFQFPFICIGEPLSFRNVSWIDINNIMAGSLAVEHLVEEGYSKPAFIGGNEKDGISSKRLKGYKEALQSAGLGIYNEYIKTCANPEQEKGYKMALQLLELENRPDSIICTSNFLAFGVLQALKEKNISIPDQIAVVCFDNYPLAEYTVPPLTAVDIDVFELGVFAARNLLEIIKKPEFQIQSNLMNIKVIKRESTIGK